MGANPAAPRQCWCDEIVRQRPRRAPWPGGASPPERPRPRSPGSFEVLDVIGLESSPSSTPSKREPAARPCAAARSRRRPRRDPAR